MHFPDLTKRLITSLISLIILGGMIAFSQFQVVKWSIVFLACGVGSIGIWEFARLAGLNEKKGLTCLSLLIGALTVLMFFLSTLSPRLVYLPFGSIFFAALVLLVYHFNQISGSIGSFSKSFFSVCYIAVPIGLILKILYFQESDEIRQSGSIWCIYVIAITKITDIGAYFGGRLIGRRKLASILSPSKTVGGAIVGFFSAVALSISFYLLKEHLHYFHLTFFQSLYLGSALGIISQIGDLGESLFKRDAGVKDSNALSGLGGVLDMLDSLLLTTPVVYLFLSINR